MITWFRNLAQSWVAKVLFILLILSFGIWGIEDVVRNFGRETALVRMEGAEIEVPQAQVAARRALQTLQRQLGPTFEPDPAVREAVSRQAVEGLIAEAAQRIEARRVHLATPDSQVRDYVRAIPAFQNGGEFSRLVLEQYLRQSDLTEPMFLQLVRDDLQRMQLVGAVRAGAPAPAPLVRALFGWERERRVAQVTELTLLEAAEPEPPTQAQLERFHANNPERFSTPELREVTLGVLSAETLKDQVEPSEADLRAAFESRRAQFETPERRELQQALLPTEEAAQQVATAWAGTTDLAAIAEAAQAAGGSAAALGTLTQADLPVPELAEAAFAVAPGGHTAPIRSPFGWHVLRVVAATPGTTARFEDVRERLAEEIALERAGDLAFERANKIEDALAGGATLEEAGRRQGMLVTTVRLDAQGNDAEGAPVGLPLPAAARAEALRAIFAAEMGNAPRLQELRSADAFLAVELRNVAPAALKPFESVADEVRLAWLIDARRRAQEERGGALLQAVRGGKTLEEAAREAGLRSDRFGPFGRRPEPGAPGLTVPQELLLPLFAARPNEAVMAPTRDGFAVAQLLEIVAPDPAAEAEALANARRAAQVQMAEDLETQFAEALRRRAAPRISQTLMQQVVP